MGHQPVLLAEVLGFLEEGQARLLVDATLGWGGHARGFLGSVQEGTVVALDRDAEVLAETRRAMEEEGYGKRITFHHAAFADLGSVLDAAGHGEVDAVLFDLGVSSIQLDTAGRGFTFREDAPLDMRMDRSGGETAADLIDRLSQTDLADLIFELGEERASRKIAAEIVRERRREPIRTTGRLAEIVRRVVRGGRGRIDKATRTFQALRMAVNDELSQLRAGLDAAAGRLRPGGRLLAIAFHSGEDRIVKRFLRSDERLEVLTRKVLRPSSDEVRRNPRARSSRLRVACRRGRRDHA